MEIEVFASISEPTSVDADVFHQWVSGVPGECVWFACFVHAKHRRRVLLCPGCQEIQVAESRIPAGCLDPTVKYLVLQDTQDQVTRVQRSVVWLRL
jgi:hypothetical protein